VQRRFPAVISSRFYGTVNYDKGSGSEVGARNAQSIIDDTDSSEIQSQTQQVLATVAERLLERE
jgi:hypothetical protein